MVSLGTEDEFPERYYREELEPMPKSRLVSIDGVLKGIESISNGQLTMDEITDALDRVMDGHVIIYDGSWKGLCPAIDGSPYDEYSGFNRRQDIITDFFNSKYWESQDYSFKGHDGKFDVRDYLILKDEGATLARRLWWYFYPNSGIDTDAVLGLDKSPLPDGIHAEQNTNHHQECAEKLQFVIHGKTFSRLQRAITDFPIRYSEYQSKPPKLDDDVRPWLKSNHGASDREAHVFGAIIAEHFNL